MTKLKPVAGAEFRTIAGQIEIWAKVGKAALDNLDLPFDVVRDLPVARNESRKAMTEFIPWQYRR